MNWWKSWKDLSWIYCLQLPPAKNVRYFNSLLIFLQFDKCDVISHLHTATGRNLTGQFFNRPITVAPKIAGSSHALSCSSMGHGNRPVKKLACYFGPVTLCKWGMASHFSNFEKYNRPLIYWGFFPGGNSIWTLRQKSWKTSQNSVDGILRSGKPILISRNSIQSLANISLCAARISYVRQTKIRVSDCTLENRNP